MTKTAASDSSAREVNFKLIDLQILASGPYLSYKFLAMALLRFFCDKFFNFL